MSAQKPTATVRLGPVQAAIWRNDTKDGYPRFNTTLERLYKDEEGNWQTSHSLGRDELLLASKVLDRAHTKVYDLLAKDRDHQREDAGVDREGRSR